MEFNKYVRKRFIYFIKDKISCPNKSWRNVILLASILLTIKIPKKKEQEFIDEWQPIMSCNLIAI